MKKEEFLENIIKNLFCKYLKYKIYFKYERDTNTRFIYF